MGNTQARDENSVGGTCQIGLASMLRSRIIWCVGEAERIKGSPGTTPEVATVFQHHYGNMINTSWLNAFIQNLYREDTFYADKGMLIWSL